MTALRFLQALVIILFLCRFSLSHSDTRNLGEPVPTDFQNDTIIRRFAFGSCNHHNRAQPLWKAVKDLKPDAWLWVGDAVYGDKQLVPLVWVPSSLPEFAGKFQAQKEIPEYKSLVDTGIPILGVWDDHDFGKNAGGKDFEVRLRGQDIFLDFLDEPLDSVRRHREGVYASYLYGEGTDKSVKVILLDTRSYLDTSKDCDVLGKEQWKWLEDQLLRGPQAKLTIVASGMQVLSDIALIDKWANCPKSLDKLIWLAQKVPRVIFLSGDVHFGEISCMNVTGSGYPLFEVTSSGLNHNCVSLLHRSACQWILNHVHVSSYRTNDITTRFNFGLINIDWEKSPVEISLEVHEQHGPVLHQVITLDQLEKKVHADSCPKAVAQPSHIYALIFWGIIFLMVASVLFLILRFLCSRIYRLIILKLVCSFERARMIHSNGVIKKEL